MSQKIEQLTIEQENLLTVCRQQHFNQLLRIDLADRPKAEEAVLELVKGLVTTVPRVIWVNSIEEGDRIGSGKLTEFYAPLQNSLITLCTEMRTLFSDSVYTELSSLLDKAVFGALRATFYDALCGTLFTSLRCSLHGSLSEARYDSLRLSDTIYTAKLDIFYSSLFDLLYNAVYDSGRTALYSFCRDVLGVVYDPVKSHQLDLWNTLWESCFAAWITPKTIVLCERPKTVKIVDGKLDSFTWHV